MEQEKKSSFQIITIPLFYDNFCFLILGTGENKGVLVDPADPKAVLTFLEKYPHLQISHVLFTHKHADHTGLKGPQELKQSLYQFNNNNHAEFVIHKQDSLDFPDIITLPLEEKLNVFEVNGLEVTGYHAPCHTKGHLLYNFDLRRNNFQPQFSESDLQILQENDTITSKNFLLTGDTLFIGGAGRFFEGNAEQMLENFDYISKLDDSTHILVGHEYTVDNYKWGIQVETNNQDLQKYYKIAQEKKEKNQHTIPSTVLQEKLANIFMRCREQNLQNLLKINEPNQVMAKLREMKNNGQVLSNL